MRLVRTSSKGDGRRRPTVHIVRRRWLCVILSHPGVGWAGQRRLITMPTHSSRRLFAALIASMAMLALVLRAAPSPGVASFTVPGRSNSTPWVAATGSFVAVAWGATAEGKKTDVFVAVSRDGGHTFGAPVQVNAVAGEARLGGDIPPRVALLAKAGSAVPEITVLWNARGETTAIRTARSRDGGKTFEAPVAMQSDGALGDRGWPALALDKQGTAHAIWLDHRGLAADRNAGAGHAGHQKSAEPQDGVAMAQKSGLYYASAKGAPSAERELAKGVCYCCKTALAVGPDGSIYAAWRHVYPGDFRDMAFTVSRDGGRSFADPVRVHEDGWSIHGCPDDGPAMAVGANGTVHLVWPTVLGGENPEGALYYASTRDGHTFSRATRIQTLGSPKPSHPQIVVDRTGRVVVAWDENLKGQRVAAARELKIGSNQAVSFGGVVTLAPEGPAMYPVLAATDRGLVAVWTTGGEASVVRARAVDVP
jgi:hypothetical protein